MARILSRVLRIVDRLYKFEGGDPSAPSEADTSGALQFVHDVSREAELGGGAGPYEGFWVVAAIQAHSAAGTIVDTVDLPAITSSALGAYRFDPLLDWAWLYDWWGNVSDPTDFNSARVGIGVTTSQVGIHDGTALGATPRLIRTATSTIGGHLVYSTTFPPLATPQPILSSGVAGDLGTLVFTSVSDGVVIFSCRHNALIWIGRRGCMPPGLH